MNTLILIYILLYSIGCVAALLLLGLIVKAKNLLNNKLGCILVALLSWVSVIYFICLFIANLVGYIRDNYDDRLDDYK